jgi:PPK2 family polyphosphate:nucleotide phosphotransferase
MDQYLLKPESKVSLSKLSSDDTANYTEAKDGGLEQLEKLRVELRDLQAVLRAEQKHKVLIILQGMDASGKDGTVRHVFYGVTHFGIRVVPFEKPTPEELAHDYLWRVHQEVPRNGEIVVFNRSHYEDVLAVRVRELQPKSVWKKRFDHINNFEQMLIDEGTVILKFFLHIDQDEQKRRLQQRIDFPHKHWKFCPSDIEDRKLWKEYTEAYEEVMLKTNKPHAPWYVVPANKKWYRNLVIASLLVDTLRELKMKFPPSKYDLSKYKIV